MRYVIAIAAGVLVAASAGALYVADGPLTVEERLYVPHLYDGVKGGSDAPAVPHDYDVREYVIDVKLNDAQKRISGSCAITATSLKDNLTKPQFNLESDMNVTAVKQGGEDCAFSHSGAVLEVTLRAPVNKDANFTITVTYNGAPQDGLYFTTSGVYVCSAMEEAQHWFPCFDLPYDKADRVKLIVTCRNDWYVAGNGVLESEKSNPDGTKTFTWVTNHRIATYLISISGAYEYSRFGTSWNGVPINYYVFPESRSAAEICFANVKSMMNFFSNKFWRYPFDDERYGIAQAEMGYFGGMENQTCITLNRYYIRPDHSSDHVLAHELSHMWWGDCISPGSWKDLWLNEGLATYCDALWEEHAVGKEAYRTRMQAFAAQYFAEDQGHRFPVYDPAEPWSATVYEKGAWVMHMLRYVMGDEAFFRAWNRFGREHEYGHAFTYELQRTMEDEHGASLEKFFRQWVYKAGYPVYEYDWTTSGNNVTIDICQVQPVTPITPLFAMPVELTITTQSNGTRVEKVTVDKRFQRFRFSYGSPVTNVEFDKNGWILCKKDRVVDIPVTSFDATPVPAAVRLSWTTSESMTAAGFNLYREAVGDDARRVKLNEDLITGRTPYLFVDRNVEPEAGYRYWLEGIGLKGERETFGPVECAAGSRAYAFALGQNRPNPARSSAAVTFSLPAAAEATLSLYDLAGRKVGAVSAAAAAGENEFVVDMSALAPGVYVYRLEAGGEAAARKMVVVK